jgi:hypothetical protein
LESDKRELAVEILRYVSQQQAANESQSEPDRAVAKRILDREVYCLWHFDELGYYGVETLCRLETATGQDGVERLAIVQDAKPDAQHDVQHASEFVPAPVPVPVSTFEPAVPLPVMQVSDVELSALALQEKRFSPENVAANVAAIIKESGPTPVITAPVIPPSAEEQKAIAGITITSPTNEKIAAIQQDGVKPLTTVESIEAQINEERDVRARYDAAQENLARLIALRDQQA